MTEETREEIRNLKARIAALEASNAPLGAPGGSVVPPWPDHYVDFGRRQYSWQPLGSREPSWRLPGWLSEWRKEVAKELREFREKNKPERKPFLQFDKGLSSVPAYGKGAKVVFEGQVCEVVTANAVDNEEFYYVLDKGYTTIRSCPESRITPLSGVTLGSLIKAAPPAQEL